MTLFVNARFLTQPVSGVQRYALELLGALDRRLSGDSTLRAELGAVVALHPGTVPADPGWTRIELKPLGSGRGHYWEQGPLWRATRDGVLLSLGNSGPVLHRRHILTLHDANIYDIPNAYAPTYRLWHKTLRPLLAHRAAALTTVSRYSARSLARHLHVAGSRFSVVPNSAQHILGCPADPQALSARGLSPGGYWLSVGNQSPNKNIARLVAAHGALDGAVPPLVIVGAAAPGLAEETNATGARFLGRVSDAELRALYDGAQAFLFPSLNEGFGIPPLEAMSLGVPVLAAKRAAMPEVLGDAALWFDAFSVEDIARAMRSFSELPPAAREKMKSAGHARAAAFTWNSSLDQLLPVLRQVCRNPGSGQALEHRSASAI